MPARTVLRRLACLAVAALITACGGESTAPDDGPSEPQPPIATTVWRTVAVGGNHACGLTTDGTAYCWGFNGFGALGVGVSGGVSFAPVPVETEHKFTALALGVNHSCALTALGETFCWGQANQGFLNDRTTTLTALPTRVVGVPAFRAISAGSNTCGLAESGAITCWEGSLIPVPPGLPTFERLVQDWTTYCGITAGGEAHCWGSNYNGQLGRLDAVAPVVVGEGLRFASLAVGKDHMCGVAVGGGVPHCWGLNQRGQLGIGRTSDFEPVSPVATMLTFDAVSVGAQSSCGLVDRKAWCWAFNAFGQVGDGSTVDRLAPVPVADDHEFASLDVGDFGDREPDGFPSVTCGVTTSGALYCWGRSVRGQLGAGPLRVDAVRPVRVVEPVLLR